MTEEKPRWLIPHMPDDVELLAALGRVSLRHGYLDLMLKVSVMRLSGLTTDEAVMALHFEGASALRDLVKRIATRRFGKASTATLRVKAILGDCALASERRNDLVHSDWSLDTSRNQLMLMNDYRKQHLPVPSAEEVNKLAERIFEVANRLAAAWRPGGFLRLETEEANAREQLKQAKED